MICVCLGEGSPSQEMKDAFLLLADEAVEAGVNTFYVGAESETEAMMLEILHKIKRAHSKMEITVVLTEDPGENWPDDLAVCPKGVEHLSGAEAIEARNEWLMFMADFFIGFMNTKNTASRKLIETAKKRKIEFFNLSQAVA
ncbi:MAG: hypothetical protein E7418_01930 [Ruminococcaceae bacterium]|nr:hypothetical protein [Oscillospiraceae bacterium]